MLNNFGGARINQGIRVSFQAPWVSHLLFADESLIFLKANIQSEEWLNEILHIYATCSGQAMNRDNNSIFFSGNNLTTATTTPQRESQTFSWDFS